MLRTPTIPGVYLDRAQPLRQLTGERMDVCAFVGLAPRGPARERQAGTRAVRRSVPRAVESWDEYRRLYGGTRGPGRLADSVSAFFQQGGRRAYIVRIVHRYDGPEDEGGAATGDLPGLRPQGAAAGAGLRLVARSEGSWGSRLRASLAYSADPLLTITPDGAPGAPAPGAELLVDRDAAPPVGSMIRSGSAGPPALHEVIESGEVWTERTGRRVRRLTVSPPLPAGVDRLEVILGDLAVWEEWLADEPELDRAERHTGLGLSPRHPRWLGSALLEDSELVYPDAAWLETPLELPPEMEADAVVVFSGGEDRYDAVTASDFLDPDWMPVEDEPGDGVLCLAELPDLSLLVVPDLYAWGEAAGETVVFDPESGPAFRACGPAVPRRTVAAPDPLAGLRVAVDTAQGRAEVLRRQRDLAAAAALLDHVVLLMAVPPSSSRREIRAWRHAFDSPFIAAYHPWLRGVAARGERTELVRLDPAAVAAGIIARQEALFGVPHGPANAVAAGVVSLEEPVTDEDHGALHPDGINVFRHDPDGVRLRAARTLSRRSDYRQLSVRRLVSMIQRTLVRQMQWTVFEPNGPRLRAEVVRMVTSLLRSLYRNGAFAGATEKESFFVRCDETNNPPPAVDAGRLLVEIGLAPASPLEFIVLRLIRQGDGAIHVEG